MLVAALVLTVACGDDSNGNDRSGPVVLRGGERLAWDQAADSIGELSSLTFRLYVDGTEAPLSAARCDAAARPSGFECSGGLPPMSPGQHALELTSVAGGIESARSASLLVIAGSSAAATTDVVSFEHSAAPQSTICATEPAAACYRVQVLASELDPVTALTPMPDGRIMLVENGQRVRIIARDALSTTIALPAETDRQLTGLAIDPQFEKTRSVFVAWTERPRGILALNVTRYRELANELGEGATIVTGVSIAPDLPTPLAVDDAGLVYVAVPVNDAPSAQRFLGGAGAVLRFDRDGRVPASNQYGSPIVAEGYQSPLALAIEPSHRTVWLTGRGYDQLGDIAAFNVRPVAGGNWPSRPTRVAAPRTAGEPIESIAFIEGGRGSGEVQLLMSSGGSLEQVALTSRGTLRKTSDIRFGDGYFAHLVTTDEHGALYVSASTRNGSNSLLKLTRSSN